MKDTATRINAIASESAADPDGAATVTIARLRGWEARPAASGRRPSVQVLALLACVYNTDIHHLLDLADREKMGPLDLPLIDRTVRTSAHGQASELARRPAASAPGPLPPAQRDVGASLSDGSAMADPDARLAHALARPASVDLVTVARPRRRLVELSGLYDRTPSAGLVADAAACLGQIRLLRENARDHRPRRELLAAEAEAAILMGQLVWDASRRRDGDHARRFFTRAVEAGREVRGPLLVGLALLRASFIALYTDGGRVRRRHGPCAGCRDTRRRP